MDTPAVDGPVQPTCHLVYVSRALQARTPTNLRRLLQEAREGNRRDALSGLLIYHQGFFLQCLEGPAEAVAAAFGRIRADTRHEDVRTLLHAPIGRRSFHRWFLAYTEVGAMTWYQILTAPWPGEPETPSALLGSGPAAAPAKAPDAEADESLAGIVLLRRCWDVYRFEAATNAGPPSH